MKARDEPLYIGIEDPSAIRRSLLESIKSLIRILQTSDKVKATRREKKEVTVQLKDTVVEMYALLGNLKASLPKIPLAHLPKKQKPKTIHQKVEQKLEKKEKQAPVVPDLNKELDDIEAKLRDLA